MKTYYLLVVFAFISVNIFSQSRKEQIVILTNQIDSLKQAVEKNKSEISNKISALKQVNASLSERDSLIKELTAQLNTYESQNKALTENSSVLSKKLEELENRQSSAAAEYSKLIQEIENKNYQIISLQKRYEIFEINEFVQNIYSSLELPGPENSISSAGDSTKLDLTKFNSFLDSNAVYSDKKVANLSGEQHRKYFIKLVKVESVNAQSDHFIVVANVMYDIYQTGTFYNNELLIIIKEKGLFKLSRWSDINMQKMELVQNVELQNFSEKDFYNTIGSLNK